MPVITVLAGGKILAKETGTAVTVNTGVYIKAINVKMNDLRKAETVIGINLKISPVAAQNEHIGPAIGAKITDNVVGFTVNDIATVAGMTITPEVIAEGYA